MRKCLYSIFILLFRRILFKESLELGSNIRKSSLLRNPLSDIINTMKSKLEVGQNILELNNLIFNIKEVMLKLGSNVDLGRSRRESVIKDSREI